MTAIPSIIDATIILLVRNVELGVNHVPLMSWSYFTLYTWRMDLNLCK